MKKAILLFLLVMPMVSTESLAQVSEEYKENLLELLKLNGFEEQFSMAISEVTDLHKKLYNADVPEALWKEMEEEIREAAWPYILNELASVYVNYYTLSDLRTMVQFYQSPVGKKITEHSEQVTRETMALAKTMGSKIRKELNYKLKQNGYE